MGEVEREDYVIVKCRGNVWKGVEVMWVYEGMECMVENEKGGYEGRGDMELE